MVMVAAGGKALLQAGKARAAAQQQDGSKGHDGTRQIRSCGRCAPIHDAVWVLAKNLHLPLVPLRAEVALEAVLVTTLLLAHLQRRK